MNPLLRLIARVAAPIVNTVNRVIQAVAPESQFAQAAQSFTQSVNTTAGLTRGNTPVSFSDNVRGTESRPAVAPTSTSDRLRDTGTGNYSAPAPTPAQPTMTAEQRRQAELNRQAEATKKHIGFEDMGHPAPPPRPSAAAPTSTSDRLRDTGSFEYSRPAAYNQAFLQQPSVEEDVAGFLRFLAIDYDDDVTTPLEALTELFDFVANAAQSPDGSLPADLKLMLRTSEAMIPDVAAALDIWGRWGKVKTTNSFKVGFGEGIPGLAGIGQVGMGLGGSFAGLGGWGGDIERVPNDASEQDYEWKMLRDIYLSYIALDTEGYRDIDTFIKNLPEGLSPEEYAEAMEDVYGYEIILHSDNPAKSFELLTNLNVSNMLIVDYFNTTLDGSNLTDSKTNTRITGLDVFKRYFATSPFGGEAGAVPVTVHLGADGLRCDQEDCPDGRGSGGAFFGWVPLPTNASDYGDLSPTRSELLTSMYLGSDVSIATITHEFFHQFDRSFGLQLSDLSNSEVGLNQFLRTNGRLLPLDNLDSAPILTGRIRLLEGEALIDPREVFADMAMTEVMSVSEFAFRKRDRASYFENPNDNPLIGWNYTGSRNALPVDEAMNEYFLNLLFTQWNSE